MKHSTKTTLKSAALAAMMLLAAVPVSALTAIKAQAAIERPVISFNSNVQGSGRAIVVTGESVEIQEPRVQGLASNKLILRNESGTASIESIPGGTAGQTNVNAVTISSPNNNGVRRITFDKNFDVIKGGDPDPSNTEPWYVSASVNYTITAVYQNLTKEGEGIKTVGAVDGVGGTPSAITNVQSSQTLPILEESRLTLHVQNIEDENGIVFTTPQKTGIFSNVATATIDRLASDPASTDLSATSIGQRTLVVNLMESGSSSGSGSSGGNGEANTTLTFTVTGITQNDDPIEPGGDKYNYNNIVQAGTDFELIFSPIVSDPLLLEVVTPQHAMDDLKGEIRASNGESANDEYIQLATNDSLGYITQNFRLRKSLKLYEANFRIKWTWEVDDSVEGNPATDTTITINDSETGDWAPVGIRRLEDDQVGTLRAKVIYVDKDNNEYLSKDTDDEGAAANAPGTPAPTKTKVTVRGTGKPVNVTRTSYITGDGERSAPGGDTVNFKDDFDKSYSPVPGEGTPGYEDYKKELDLYLQLPSNAVMDAYRGGMGSFYPSYPKTPDGPYEYDLNLYMGAKNGTAMYGRIDVSGDTDAVTLQLDQGNGFQDYTPGERFQNDNYFNDTKAIAKEIPLKVLANERDDKRTKSVTLTFTFWLPDSAGREQEYSQHFSITFTIYDNTPSRDATLRSLTLRDADTNEAIPFGFQSDLFDYFDGNVIHLPYRTKSINLNAVLNDTASLGYNDMRFIIQDMGGVPVKGMYEGVEDPDDDPPENGYLLNHSTTSGKINFFDADGNDITERQYNIVITVPCQDPNETYWKRYTLRIVRDAPSIDDTLGTLAVYLEGGEQNLIQGFQAGTAQGDPVFEIAIPYSTQMLQILYTANDSQAELGTMAVLSGKRDGDKTDNNIIWDTLSTGEQRLYTREGYSLPTDSKQWLKQVKAHFDNLPDNADGTMTLRIPISSEKEVVERGPLDTNDPDYDKNVTHGSRYYYVIITRLPASPDPNVSTLIITDNDENIRDYTPAFRPDTENYTLEIPYSVRQIKFNITPNDPNVYKVEIWEGDIGAGIILNTDTNMREVDTSKGAKLLAKYTNGIALTEEEESRGITALRLGNLSKSFNVKDVTSDYAKKNDGVHPFHVVVWAENANYVTHYLYRVRRAEPSNDATLLNLLLKDGLNQEIKTFLFHPDQFGCESGLDDDLEPGQDTYYVSVPYSTRQISFTPTTSHEYATVEIRDGNFSNSNHSNLPSWELDDFHGSIFPYLVESTATSKLFNLSDKWGRDNAKEFHVIVRAEDYTITDLGNGRGTPSGHQRTYCIKVYREAPSDDCRLISLETQNTSNFKPIFIPKNTDYTADVNVGAPGVIVIPTANHPGATIRVDGMVVQSGSPSDLIPILDVTQTVRVEVIAEDGVTRMVYRITFTNWNLIEMTSNADLKNLTINYGLMTPNFQAAVTEYEVTTKETAWSVDIIPKLADPYATMRVLNGTRELGDYNGNYAMAIADGQNDVSVEVTSPDGTVTKTYAVAIFRNEEEKLKNMKPLEAEDINFEQVSNPIIVKIEEYPRVGSSVFNTIREEHPEMSIIFQGNDYSLRFDGKNLTRVIPQTEIYDFRMTFSSPAEDAIYDIIADNEYNDDIIDDVVMLYFDYHGSLPGPATFSLSLGRRYGNDLLYWHYYNQERDRIDYYGTLQSNSQGSVAVSIDHFSTYVVAPEHRIAGSEDKDGVVDELGMVSNGQDLLSSGGKLNPDTGAKEAP